MRPTVKLWEICDILDKKRKPITQKDRTKWIYPYYWASWVLDYVADYIFDEDLVLIWEDWAKWWALDNSAFKVSWKVWVNNHAHVIRPHREKILDDYLVYYLVSTDLSDYITWTTVPKLNQERLKLIEIPLPPLETQKAIVAKLDQIFAELDQTKSEIQKNLDNTDELRKSALNQAFQGDWEIKKLGEVIKLVSWQDLTTKEYNSSWNWIPYITWASNIENESIIINRWTEFPKSIAKEWDLLITVKWTVWTMAVLHEPKVHIARQIMAIQNEEATTIFYIKLFLETYIQKLKNSANWLIPWISRDVILNIQIPVSPLSEQEKIVEHLDQVSKEVKELKSQYQSQLDNLEELKKSVLDKAFRWEMGE